MNEVFPERRRNTRYVTLKNAVIMAVALSVAMSIVSIWHEVRPARSRPDGSLSESGLPSSDARSAHHQTMMVVEEGPVLYEHGPDSILIDPRPAPKKKIQKALPAPNETSETQSQR